MPRKRLRGKTLSLMRRTTCEHSERGCLEPKSPVVQSKANRRASEAVPALTRFERMEVRTLRCEGRRAINSMKETNGHLHATFQTVLTELGIPYGTRVLGERSQRRSLRRGQPIAWPRMTGLKHLCRDGMRDAESQPQWMPRSGKRYTRDRRTCRLGRGRWKRAGARYHLKGL